MLSVIIPAYNEELNIQRTCTRIREVLNQEGISYELLLVDDGSKDGTWNEICRAAAADPGIRGIRFSRNFGKESAIFAGLKECRGDAAAVMDCDLQHPPETLVEMYRLWEQGYQVIEGVKEDRGKESTFHRGAARLFYSLMSRSTGIDMQHASDFKLMDRVAVDSILSLPERNMFFRATSSWVGYRTIQVPFRVRERQAGKSKWSLGGLVRYAVNDIVAFTAAPLQIVTVAGIICFIFSVILGIYSLIQYFTGHAVEGYSTLLIVLLIIGSGIMLSLGIIGCYIARIYEEVKQRPRYLISEKTVNQNKNDKAD